MTPATSQAAPPKPAPRRRSITPKPTDAQAQEEMRATAERSAARRAGADRRRTIAAAAARKADDLAYLASFGLAVGDLIRVEGDRSVFRISGAGLDGSVTVIDTDEPAFRSFRPEWVFPAWRTTRRGTRVRAGVPADKKGLRDAWRAQRGVFVAGSPDFELAPDRPGSMPGGAGQEHSAGRGTNCIYQS